MRQTKIVLINKISLKQKSQANKRKLKTGVTTMEWIKKDFVT